MDRKYGALSVIATIFQIIGVLIILLAILFYGIAAADEMFNVVFSGYISLGTIISGITNTVIPFFLILLMGIGVVALGQLIHLFQDMEANSRQSAADAHVTAEQTRRMAELMERQTVNRLERDEDYPLQELPLRKEKRD